MTDFVAPTESQVDVAATIAALNDALDSLPEAAMRTIQWHRELFIPQLVESIRNATVEARNGEDDLGNAHFYALFLLTEFAAKEALPAILEAVSLPGELPEVLFGDAITELLQHTFAVLAADQPELIDALILDRHVNEYVRWAAAESLILLARDGVISRETAEQRLGEHLRIAIDTDDALLGQELICGLRDLGAFAFRDLIREAFSRLEIEPFFVQWEDVRFRLAEAEQERVLTIDYPPTAIGDSIEHLRDWCRFGNDDPNRRILDDDDIEEEDFEDDFRDDDADVDFDPDFVRACQMLMGGLESDSDEPPRFQECPEPIHALPCIGRNAPCPCGSGRKFKKCCGGRRA